MHIKTTTSRANGVVYRYVNIMELDETTMPPAYRVKMCLGRIDYVLRSRTTLIDGLKRLSIQLKPRTKISRRPVARVPRKRRTK